MGAFLVGEGDLKQAFEGLQEPEEVHKTLLISPHQHGAICWTLLGRGSTRSHNVQQQTRI